MKIRTSRAALAIAVAGALLPAPAPAYADGGPDGVAETAARAAEDAGVPQPDIAPAALQGDALVATTAPQEPATTPSAAAAQAQQALAGTTLTEEESATIVEVVRQAAADVTVVSTVSLPVSAAGEVTVDPSGAVPAVSIGLPTTPTHSNAKVASNGTVVYQDRTGAVDVAAQSLQDRSLRVQTVLNGPESSTEFRYPLELTEGTVARLTADGGIDVVRPTAAVDEVETTTDVLVNRIAPAWARDAEGRAVPTRYELRAGEMVQHVEHQGGGSAYPITAAPWWNTAYNIASCAAAVVFVALTTVFVAGKAVKTVKAVNAVRHRVGAVRGAAARRRQHAGRTRPRPRACP